MSHEARGAFEVQLTPKSLAEGEAPDISRMGLDKTFHGDLDGVSVGQMLAFRSSVEGSAGYVAMESFLGSLDGRTGGFQMQHMGTMDRGEPHLRIEVIPDSGTGALEGITGTMDIEITEGKHFYTLQYTLPSDASPE